MTRVGNEAGGLRPLLRRQILQLDYLLCRGQQALDLWQHGPGAGLAGRGQDVVDLGPNSIGNFWLEKPLEFWLEIPYTNKKLKNG